MSHDNAVPGPTHQGVACLTFLCTKLTTATTDMKIERQGRSDGASQNTLGGQPQCITYHAHSLSPAPSFGAVTGSLTA